MSHESLEPAPFPSDLEIAQAAETRHVRDVAGDLGLDPADLDLYGDDVAKVSADALDRRSETPMDGKLVLVTAMTPTPRGEGKTVTTVGLGQAFGQLGESAVVAIREPSMGPVFGMKGGAAGGGYAQVLPMEDINLHFTGDLHAVTAAHNLLAAMVDNHLHRENDLGIDPRRVVWPRTLDVDDRSLREVVVGLGGTANGVPRESSFEITAASEVMAVLSVASDLADLRERLSNIIVAYTRDDEPVTAGDLGAAGAMTAILRDAIRPNLVQTLEGTPAFVHGGPFANIALGTNTVRADRLGLRLADYVVTEAGFGADLGAEKFFDVVSRHGVAPNVAVVVATVRALRHHGGGDESMEAIRRGLANLDHHVDVLREFGVPVVVAVNRFPDDTDAEVGTVVDHCEARGVPAAVSTVHHDGGEGGVDLARLVRDHADEGATATPLYDLDASLEEKIRTVATRVYGADGVEFTDAARTDLQRLSALGFDEMPVCLSKTPASLSDESDRLGVPTDWTLTVRELRPAAGAGFVVALTGDVMTMPGLPTRPAALDVDVDDDGNVTGLF